MVNVLLVDLRKEGFLVYGYAYDIAILVRENFLNTVRHLMTNTLSII
jgi:hypothetical protein